ncbi:uncharacterized protein [Panulirus ornatus]|uniref:uncharacterized protein n=1 Tax=Panulirus ornatus TaxID=150431 RepID=UPI003A8A3499
MPGSQSPAVTEVPTENSSRVSEGVNGIASLAVLALDGDSTHFAGQGTTADSEGGTRLASPIDGGGTPHSPTHPTDGLPLILATSARQGHFSGRYGHQPCLLETCDCEAVPATY